MRGLRRGSAAARLLGLWVRIPQCAWMLSLVSVVYYQVEVSASRTSPVQRSPTECGVSECDREVSTVRRPWPVRGCRAMGKSTHMADSDSRGTDGIHRVSSFRVRSSRHTRMHCGTSREHSLIRTLPVCRTKSG
jgi:hypothetical protein